MGEPKGDPLVVGALFSVEARAMAFRAAYPHPLAHQRPTFAYPSHASRHCCTLCPKVPLDRGGIAPDARHAPPHLRRDWAHPSHRRTRRVARSCSSPPSRSRVAQQLRHAVGAGPRTAPRPASASAQLQRPRSAGSPPPRRAVGLLAEIYDQIPQYRRSDMHLVLSADTPAFDNPYGVYSYTPRQMEQHLRYTSGGDVASVNLAMKLAVADMI